MHASQTNSILIRALSNETDSEELWTQFYDSYRSTVVKWCRQEGVRDHEANDVLQATMVKMFMHIHTYDRDKGKFTPWLKTIVRNEIRDRFRKAGKSEVIAPIGGSTNQQVIANYEGRHELESNLEEESIVAEVFKAVREKVKDENWSMFIQAKFLGQDASSLAKEFEVKRATVHQNVYRISKMLKAKCEEVLWSDDSENESLENG